MLAGLKIRDRFFPHGVRIARQHDRRLDRAAMNAVTISSRKTVHPARRSETSSW
jgi:hypothetical protein